MNQTSRKPTLGAPFRVALTPHPRRGKIVFGPEWMRKWLLPIPRIGEQATQAPEQSPAP